MTQNTQEITGWIRNASPDELAMVVKQGLSRISSLDQTHRDAFYKSVQSETNITKLFDKQTA